MQSEQKLQSCRKGRMPMLDRLLSNYDDHHIEIQLRVRFLAIISAFCFGITLILFVFMIRQGEFGVSALFTLLSLLVLLLVFLLIYRRRYHEASMLFVALGIVMSVLIHYVHSFHQQDALSIDAFKAITALLLIQLFVIRRRDTIILCTLVLLSFAVNWTVFHYPLITSVFMNPSHRYELILLLLATMTLVFSRILFDRIIQQLTASENNYRALFDRNPAPLAILNRSGSYITCNDPFIALYGYSREQIVGHRVGERVVADSLAQEMLAVIKSGNNLEDFEVAVNAADGSIRSVLISSRPVAWDKENAVLMITYDISALKQAQLDMHLSEEKFYKVFHSTLHIITISRLSDGVILDVNDAFVKTVGYEREECIGKTASELGLYSSGVSYETYRSMLSENREIYAMEAPFHTKYGTLRIGLLSSGIISFDGEPCLLTVGMDITDHKNAEAQKVAALEALQESEAKYRLLADNVSDVIWVMDLAWNKIHISPSVMRIHGWTPEEWMALSLDEYVPPESLEKIRNEYAKAVLSPDHRYDPDHVMTLETDMMKKDGSRFHAEVNCRLLYNERRRPTGIIGITRDITDRVRIQELMIQSEKMASVAGLAAGMAHEINNPLGIIMQTAENAERRLLGDNPANHKAAAQAGISLDQIQAYARLRNIDRYLESIHEAGSRAARIVATMLQFSRRGESNVQYLDINDILDQVLDLAENDYDLERRYDFRKINIIRDYGVVPLIPCTETELQQVFFNLLKNAAQAMSLKEYDDTTPPTIILRTNVKNNELTVEIEDNGPGIPEAVRRKIFEPFYTTKSPGIGTGLGLAVSYYIIATSHQGHLSVESVPEEWTRFAVSLPLTRARA